MFSRILSFYFTEISSHPPNTDVTPHFANGSTVRARGHLGTIRIQELGAPALTFSSGVAGKSEGGNLRPRHLP